MAASVQAKHLLRLPIGRPGRILALGLLMLVLAASWVGIVSPLLDWYDARAAQQDQRALLARRMTLMASTLPELQRSANPGAGTVAETGATPAALVDGATDAIAAATLQEQLQAMAARVGAPLSSAETIPATPAGAYRRISLHVTLRAPWPVLVRLLQSIEQASPSMLVDDLQLHGARVPAIPLPGAPVDQPLEAAFTVIAFRAAAPMPGIPSQQAKP